VGPRPKQKLPFFLYRAESGYFTAKLYQFDDKELQNFTLNDLLVEVVEPPRDLIGFLFCFSDFEFSACLHRQPPGVSVFSLGHVLADKVGIDRAFFGGGGLSDFAGLTGKAQRSG
jgi:hypothetical protein